MRCVKRFLLRGELEEALAKATQCIRVKVASQAKNSNTRLAKISQCND
jgi:hypothetical protein